MVSTSLRKQILQTEDIGQAMDMIDKSAFTISTKNSLKCLWRKNHNKSIYNKNRQQQQPRMVELTRDMMGSTTPMELCIKIPHEICLKNADRSHLFIQKQLIHSQIQFLLAQEKAIDDMIRHAINEHCMETTVSSSG